jgi:TPR repeat protein
MRYRKHLLIFFITGVSIVAQQQEGQAVNPSSTLRIPVQKLEQFMLEAVRGNGKAAFDVAIHFSIGFNDRSNGQYWNVIGAENGYPGCQWNLAYDLTYDNARDIRGIFWIKTAAQNGEEYAVEMLQDLGITLNEKFFDESVFDDNDGILPNDKIREYKEGALMGSQKAALALVNFFKKNNDTNAMEYWYRIGAQNGSAECQYNLGHILTMKSEHLNQERGLFWLNLARHDKR